MIICHLTESHFREKIKSRSTLVKSYNFDILLLGEYWNCFPNRSRIYHHTISSTLLYGFREAIALFIEQGGLQSSWYKHMKVSTRLYAKLEASGFALFIENKKHRCPSVTSIKVPTGVDALKVAAHVMKKYRIEVAGGLGPTAGQIFRVGLMGVNATQENADKLVKVLVDGVAATKDAKLVSKI